jgi:hypothetical protein
VLDAETVGEIIADGLTANRFLVVTAPEVLDELRERAADIEAYLARVQDEYP